MIEDISRSSESARLENLLLLWVEFMLHGDHFEVGFPKEIFYFATGGKNHCEDFYEEIDINHANIMNTIINDLPEKERAAINFKYLGHKYMYDSTGYEYTETLENAKIRIEEKAKEKNIW
jgi:hypothetical protein